MSLQELMITVGIWATISSTLVTETPVLIEKVREIGDNYTRIIEEIDDPDLNEYLNSLYEG